MTTKHKLRATIPHGPKDMGAELDAEIAFTFLPGAKPSHDDPGYPPEIEFVGAAQIVSGLPMPFHGAFADMEQDHLDELCRNWLESDEGQAAAMAEVAAEAEDARAFIAELRRERT